MQGRPTALIASNRASDVWVKAPPFRRRPSKALRAAPIRSRRTPSWFDWNASTVAPSSAARSERRRWMSASVSLP
jgi:hypothetical protein